MDAGKSGDHHHFQHLLPGVQPGPDRGHRQLPDHQVVRAGVPLHGQRGDNQGLPVGDVADGRLLRHHRLQLLHQGVQLQANPLHGLHVRHHLHAHHHVHPDHRLDGVQIRHRLVRGYLRGHRALLHQGDHLQEHRPLLRHRSRHQLEPGGFPVLHLGIRHLRGHGQGAGDMDHHVPAQYPPPHSDHGLCEVGCHLREPYLLVEAFQEGGGRGRIPNHLQIRVSELDRSREGTVDPAVLLQADQGHVQDVEQELPAVEGPAHRHPLAHSSQDVGHSGHSAVLGHHAQISAPLVREESPNADQPGLSGLLLLLQCSGQVHDQAGSLPARHRLHLRSELITRHGLLVRDTGSGHPRVQGAGAGRLRYDPGAHHLGVPCRGDPRAHHSPRPKHELVYRLLHSDPARSDHRPCRQPLALVLCLFPVELLLPYCELLHHCGDQEPDDEPDYQQLRRQWQESQVMYIFLFTGNNKKSPAAWKCQGYNTDYLLMGEQTITEFATGQNVVWERRYRYFCCFLPSQLAGCTKGPHYYVIWQIPTALILINMNQGFSQTPNQGYSPVPNQGFSQGGNPYAAPELSQEQIFSPDVPYQQDIRQSLLEGAYAADTNKLINKKKSNHIRSLISNFILWGGVLGLVISQQTQAIYLQPVEMFFSILGIYLFYLLLALCKNPLFAYLSNIEHGVNFDKAYNETRQLKGHFQFDAMCYHYETRHHTRTVRDANGNTKTEHYTTQQQVVTHRATEFLYPITCEDDSGNVDPVQSDKDVIFVHNKVNYRFNSDYSRTRYMNEWNGFQLRNKRDVHQSYWSNFNLPGLKARLCFFVGDKPQDFSCFLVVCSLLGFAWPASMHIESKVSRFEIEFMKIVGL